MKRFLIVVLGIGLIALGAAFVRDYATKRLPAGQLIPPETTHTELPAPTTSIHPTPVLPPVRLSLDAPGSLTLGEPSIVDVVLETGTTEVSNADLILTYDPDMLEVTVIEAGTFFTKPLLLNQAVDAETGRVSASVGSFDLASGTGVLVRLTVVPLAPGPAILTIMEDSLVVAKGPVPAPITAAQPITVTIN